MRQLYIRPKSDLVGTISLPGNNCGHGQWCCVRVTRLKRMKRGRYQVDSDVEYY